MAKTFFKILGNDTPRSGEILCVLPGCKFSHENVCWVIDSENFESVKKVVETILNFAHVEIVNV